jgi:hypothetical protein
MKAMSGKLVFGLSLLILPVAFASGAVTFETLDANGDGKVSRGEFRTAKEKEFRKMDKNRDGVVTSGELATAVDAHEGDKAAFRAQWKVMDLNEDGRISKSELSSGIYTAFSEMDADKDGALSRQELE